MESGSNSSVFPCKYSRLRFAAALPSASGSVVSRLLRACSSRKLTELADGIGQRRQLRIVGAEFLEARQAIYRIGQGAQRIVADIQVNQLDSAPQTTTLEDSLADCRGHRETSVRPACPENPAASLGDYGLNRGCAVPPNPPVHPADLSPACCRDTAPSAVPVRRSAPRASSADFRRESDVCRLVN